MKSFKLLSAIFTLVIAFTFVASAADNSTANATGTFQATVGAALQMATSAATPIDFGTIAPGGGKDFTADNTIDFNITGQPGAIVELAQEIKTNDQSGLVDKGITFTAAWTSAFPTAAITLPADGKAKLTYQVTHVAVASDATASDAANLTVKLTANYTAAQ